MSALLTERVPTDFVTLSAVVNPWELFACHISRAWLNFPLLPRSVVVTGGNGVSLPVTHVSRVVPAPSVVVRTMFRVRPVNALRFLTRFVGHRVPSVIVLRHFPLASLCRVDRQA